MALRTTSCTILCTHYVQYVLRMWQRLIVTLHWNNVNQPLPRRRVKRSGWPQVNWSELDFGRITTDNYAQASSCDRRTKSASTKPAPSSRSSWQIGVRMFSGIALRKLTTAFVSFAVRSDNKPDYYTRHTFEWILYSLYRWIAEAFSMCRWRYVAPTL